MRNRVNPIAMGDADADPSEQGPRERFSRQNRRAAGQCFGDDTVAGFRGSAEPAAEPFRLVVRRPGGPGSGSTGFASH